MSTSTRTISLFCPSLPNDVDNFTFSTTTSYDNILSDIRAALGATSAIWPYDARKQPIEDFAMLKERQNVLIATDYFELPLDIARDVRVVQRGGAERAWMVRITSDPCTRSFNRGIELRSARTNPSHRHSKLPSNASTSLHCNKQTFQPRPCTSPCLLQGFKHTSLLVQMPGCPPRQTHRSRNTPL
jgi:hypothetical protein